MKMSETKFNKEVFPNFDDDSVKKWIPFLLIVAHSVNWQKGFNDEGKIEKPCKRVTHSTFYLTIIKQLRATQWKMINLKIKTDTNKN